MSVVVGGGRRVVDRLVQICIFLIGNRLSIKNIDIIHILFMYKNISLSYSTCYDAHSKCTLVSKHSSSNWQCSQLFRS